ncbi:hypothetical protein [Sulfoacidibacillus thermotolerans]|uniref:Uncharacterized protein n=1 Tax=Sulfoacidibacillus thermotolerans TaxID=1765684 RepID=A0A2U3DBP5_SULT2|nr:hypothetical protein [Sulfoacidibacillus thermotolerans]PWI58685.1 hypothetical protein BM613_00885 [Sulfoacidibacillus thermotolerans]
MAEGHKPLSQPSSARDAEELLRKTAHSNEDPFLAISHSIRQKGGTHKLSPRLLEDDDEQ